MRRALALAALALGCAGCSLLYDPAKAPLPRCPVGPDACPAVPNAVAACAGSTCQYSCASGFADFDGNLAAVGSNGCEVSCSALEPLPIPSGVAATAGTSGA